MSWGWSVMKVGLMQSTSRNSPTSLSSSLAGVCGGAQSSLCFLHYAPRPANKSEHGSRYTNRHVVSSRVFCSTHFEQPHRARYPI